MKYCESSQIWGIFVLFADQSIEGPMDAPAEKSQIEALINAHYAELYRYAVRLSRSHADAEDLTQSAFLTAQQKLDQLREPAQARAWLFAILRNSYLKLSRNSQSRNHVSLTDLEDPSDDLTEIPELTGEELTAALDELADEFRVPLVLFYFEDLCYRDIAEVLDLPPGTVMSRLSRAKSHLRQQLTRSRTSQLTNSSSQ